MILRNTVYLLAFLYAAALFGCGGPQYHSRVLHTDSNKHLKGHQKPYEINGRRYYPLLDYKGYAKEGMASWYGKDFHGKKTSNGETYNMYAMTAAHKTLPLGVFVRVTNLDNNNEVVLRVNDRGPFVDDRIIDLSYTAAKKLGVVGPGTAPVKVVALGYEKPSSQSVTGKPQTVKKQPLVKQPVSQHPPGNYAVQVGSFSDEYNARQLADELGRRYGHAGLKQGAVNGTMFYRVYAGKYGSHEEATAALVEFVIDGFEGIVVAVD